MRTHSMFLAAALAAFALGSGSRAIADDVVAKAGERVVVVVGDGDGAARFYVTQDRTAGSMTFRLSDPAVKVTEAPIVVVTTNEGPKDVRLVAVEGQTGTWRLVHDNARAERFEGTMKVVIDGKSYSAPVLYTAVPEPTPGEVKFVARHGGRAVVFPDCAANVEIVQDLQNGTLTIYSNEDVKILEAPVITITESRGPATVTVTKVDGPAGVWRITHPTLKTTTYSGRIRILVNGKPCEAPLFFAGPHGGQIVTVENGPRFEIVRDERARYYTFYAIDDTVGGKVYTINEPQVVVTTSEGPRTVVLTPVQGEPRAWRLVGLDAKSTGPLDGRLRFTLFGRSLETRLGISGFGIDLR